MLFLIPQGKVSQGKNLSKVTSNFTSKKFMVAALICQAGFIMNFLKVVVLYQYQKNELGTDKHVLFQKKILAKCLKLILENTLKKTIFMEIPLDMALDKKTIFISKQWENGAGLAMALQKEAFVKDWRPVTEKMHSLVTLH